MEGKGQAQQVVKAGHSCHAMDITDYNVASSDLEVRTHTK